MTSSVAFSLFKRIGGRKAVEAAVTTFYDKVLADPDLDSFFVGVDRGWLERQQAKFFTQALGGPAIYDGADMVAAHARLPIENRHFDKVAGHLSAALTELGVKPEARDEVLSAIAGLRDTIVNASGSSQSGNGASGRNGLSALGDDALQKTLASLQTNLFVADADLNLVYMNDRANETLRLIADEVRQAFGVEIDEIHGGSIHRFHRNPRMVERILRDPKALPHEAKFTFGRITLSSMINSITDARGRVTGYVVNWEDISERVILERAQARVHSMMENAPTNVIYADRDLNMQYMNPASVQTMLRLEQWLPIKVNEFIGASIDVFHKDPAHQRRIVGDPRNLPHKAIIDIGPEKVELLASAIMDDKGEYLGPMITWEIISEKLEIDAKLREMAEREKNLAQELREKVDSLLSVVDAAAGGDLTQEVTVSGDDAIGKMGEGLARFLADMRANIGDLARQTEDLSQSAESLNEVSQQMAGSADETSTQANLVSEGAQAVNAHVKSVSAGVEEMNASIRDVARNATEAAEVATNAVAIAQDANTTVSKLGQSSNEIGNVVRVITSIAQQTKLLALNATIEAARAGEAGKGFAVVANEVKELAKETANATEDISRKIEAIQGDTTGAIAAIEKIGEIIGEINELQNRIAGAVEQQSATSNSVAQNLGEAAVGTDEITQNIGGVAEAAGETSKAASGTQSSAQDLAQLSNELRKIVQRFTY